MVPSFCLFVPSFYSNKPYFRPNKPYFRPKRTETSLRFVQTLGRGLYEPCAVVCTNLNIVSVRFGQPLVRFGQKFVRFGQKTETVKQ